MCGEGKGSAAVLRKSKGLQNSVHCLALKGSSAFQPPESSSPPSALQGRQGAVVSPVIRYRYSVQCSACVLQEGFSHWHAVCITGNLLAVCKCRRNCLSAYMLSMKKQIIVKYIPGNSVDSAEFSILMRRGKELEHSAGHEKIVG